MHDNDNPYWVKIVYNGIAYYVVQELIFTQRGFVGSPNSLYRDAAVVVDINNNKVLKDRKNGTNAENQFDETLGIKRT